MSQQSKSDQLPLFPGTARPATAGSLGEVEADDNDQRKQNDLVFKTVFRHFFGDLVELVEPDFASRVDLTNVEFLDPEAFSDFPAGLRRLADIVVRLKSRDGEERIVLVQVEVEGEFRTEMDERAFLYYMYLRMKYRVPVLLIAVFLRGGRKPLAMREFVDEAEGVEVCRFRYLAFCLGQSRAKEFLDRPQPLAPGLAALMRSSWDPVEKRLRCLKAIGHKDVDEARRFLLAKVVDLYVELDEAQAARFAAEVAKEGNEEVREMVITWEETIADRVARGKIALARDHILRILKQRFESVPAFVRQKIEGIQSLERLEGILDQAIVVSSVDDLVLEP
jgi:hypothetical protein